MKTFLPFTKDSLEDSVFALRQVSNILSLEEKYLKKSIKCNHVCLEFLGGVLDTHSRIDIPKHDSGESLFFFKNKDDEPVLIEELKPPLEFMPSMKRISIHTAKTHEMKHGGYGHVIQRVFFNAENGRHEIMIICFKRFIFETF